MVTKFLDEAGGHLAQRWVTTVLGPSLAFWLPGLVAIIWSYGWDSFENWIKWFGQQSQLIQGVLGIGGVLLIIIVSTVTPKPFELKLLRLLEGYWPFLLKFLADWRVQHQISHAEKVSSRFQRLSRESIDVKLREKERESVTDRLKLHVQREILAAKEDGLAKLLLQL
jgi:hypothetical protein